LTDQVIHDHLTGKLTAGVYPLLADETCWLLAACGIGLLIGYFVWR